MVSSIVTSLLVGTTLFVSQNVLAQATRASLVDLTSNTILSTFSVGLNPTGVAWSGNDVAYVVNDDGNTLVRLNMTTSPPSLSATFTLPGTNFAPHSITVSPDGMRGLVVGDQSSALLLNLKTTPFTVVDTIPIPGDAGGVAFYAAGAKGIIVSGSNILFLNLTITPAGVTTVAIPTPLGGHAVSVNPLGTRAVVTLDEGRLQTIDLTTNPPRLLGGPLGPAPADPLGCAISPDGSTAIYVDESLPRGEAIVVNIAGFPTWVNSVSLPLVSPSAVAFNPVTGAALIAADSGIVVLDPPYTEVSTTILHPGRFGATTYSIAVNPAGTRALVLHEDALYCVPYPIEFGDVLLGTTSRPFNMTCTNSGTGPASLTSLAASGPGFALTGVPALPINVAAGGTFSFGVTFTPPGVGPQTGSVDGSSADGGLSLDYTATGNGVSTLSSTVTVPIVLSSGGLAGSFFTSELALTNRGSRDVSISYAYTAAFGGANGSAVDSLQAGRQKIVADAITYLRSLGIPLGDSGNRGGTLKITFNGLSSLDAAAATVRTTTAVPEGRAGLAYAGLRPSKLLSAPAYLCGLRQNATDRSNVAVINAGGSSGGEIRLRLTVVSGDPANPVKQALPDITLAPGAFSQVSGVLGSNGLSVTNGYVKVERVSGTAPFYAYAVINDQANSDGSFVEPVMAVPAAPVAALTLPVIVETSAFSTELVLTNFSTASRTLNATYTASAIPSGSITFSLQLLPNEQQILPSFVQVLRDRRILSGSPGTTFVGALFVTDTTGDLRGVSVGARTSTPGGGGRYGLFYSAVPAGAEATTAAWLYALQQNAENRTNLALVVIGSTDSLSDTFHIDLYDGATGQKAGSTDVTVPANGFTQTNTIFATVAPGVASGYALVTRTSGNNPFITYAVVNDGGLPGQRSGDGAFVEATLPD